MQIPCGTNKVKGESRYSLWVFRVHHIIDQKENNFKLEMKRQDKKKDSGQE
jgi:hypothetical protein